MPKISIIIPVYNAEKYLEECLLSISQQNFSDFEIWAINDGSKDRSLEILKRHQEKEPRLNILSQENKGVSAARNLGLESAQGEYITFVDADDVLAKDIFTSLNLEIENSTHDLVLGNFMSKNGNREIDFKNVEKDYISKEELISDFITWKLKIRLGSFLIKRSLVYNNNLKFLETLKYAEDVYFITKSLYYSTSVKIVNKLMYIYLYNDYSTIIKVGFDRFDSFKAKNDLYYFFKNQENYHTVNKIYIGYQLPEAIIDVVELLCQNGYNMHRILKYLKENDYLKWIDNHCFNDFTPKHIEEKINKFQNNPYWFCFNTKLKLNIGKMKTKVFNLYKKL